MKKLFILLFIFTTFLVNVSFATTTNVTAGAHKIIDAVNAAADGDIIVLTTSGGAYVEQWTITLDKNITIKAAAGLAEKPIISFNNGIWNMFTLNFPSDKTVTFDGIVFDGYVDATTNSDRCFWIKNGTTTYSFYVNNCEFKNFDNEIMVAENNGVNPATIVSFENSKFLDLASNALFFRTWNGGTSPGNVTELVVENCTFWNVGGFSIDVGANDTDYGTLDPKVTINHVTIYSSTLPGNYDAIKLDYCDYATVKNSIVKVTDQTNNSGTIKIWGANSVANNNVTQTQWNIVGYDGATKSNNLGATDPLFVDAANGDLNLQGTSPALTKGDDGANSGDTYWDGTKPPVPVELTSFTATSEGSATVLNWETATEVNNYGFEVEASNDNVSWNAIAFIDGHGNSNSPNSYSYVATDGATYYRLKQIDIDGGFEYSDVVEVTSNLSYKLAQNHPNPFNPTTTVNFTLPQAARASITVYNSLGQKVMDVVNKDFSAGNHSVNINASNLSSGLYFYKLETSDFSKTMKMMLLK